MVSPLFKSLCVALLCTHCSWCQSFELWAPQWIKTDYMQGFAEADQMRYVHYDNCGLIAAYMFLGGKHKHAGGCVIQHIVHRQAHDDQKKEQDFCALDAIMEPAQDALPAAFLQAWQHGDGHYYRVPVFVTVLKGLRRPGDNRPLPRLEDLFDPAYLTRLQKASIWVRGGALLLVTAAVHHVLYNLKKPVTEDNVCQELARLLPYIAGITDYDHLVKDALHTQQADFVLLEEEQQGPGAALENRIASVYYYTMCGDDSTGKALGSWFMQRFIRQQHPSLDNNFWHVVVPMRVWKAAYMFVLKHLTLTS